MTSVFIGRGPHAGNVSKVTIQVPRRDPCGLDSIINKKRPQEKEDLPNVVGQRSETLQSGRFVNVVEVNTSDMRISAVKDDASPNSGNSSGIDTDPDKSDSDHERSDSDSFSSLGTHGSYEYEHVRNPQVFYVSEFESEADCVDDSERQLALSKILSGKGTVRGVKNRVRSGIETFLQNEDRIKNYEKEEIGKVVVYTTTMGIVRRTYDRCRLVRNILRNLMIRYDERDVFMNRSTQSELMERLDLSRVILPQVFVEGQLLGDAEYIEKLNESGDLRQLLKPYKRMTAVSTCEKCGGYKYVLCSTCSGSKKSPQVNSFTEYSPLRCMQCDEGGLVRCDACIDL